MSDKYTELFIERYLAGELAGLEKREFETRLKEDEGLARKVEALKQENEDFFKAFPVALQVEQIEEKAFGREASPVEKEGPVTRIMSYLNMRNTLSFAAALAALLVVVFIVPFNRQNTLVRDSGFEKTRIKGDGPVLQGTDIGLYQKEADGALQLNRGDAVSDGSVVQIVYICENYEYGAIVSIDGNGVVTGHLSGDGTRAVQLVTGERVNLPTAYELDDAPLYEKFYFLYSHDSFTFDALLAQIKEDAQGEELGIEEMISDDGNVRIRRFTLIKQ